MRWELLSAGLATGAVYGVVALGFVLVYKATRVFNLAQGGLMMVGTFLVYVLRFDLGLPFVVALLVALVGAVLAGLVIERVLLRPLITEPPVSSLLLTIGLAQVMKGVTGMVFGLQQRPWPGLFPEGSVQLGDVAIPLVDLYVFASGVLFVGLFAFVYTRSKWGLSMRAAAWNPDWAGLVGVNASRMTGLSWAMAGVSGTVGGVLLVEALRTVNTTIEVFALRAFPAAVLGGIDSVLGALVGGLVVGAAESLAGGYLDPYVGGGTKEVLGFVVLLAVLVVRPYGLFGTEEIERL